MHVCTIVSIYEINSRSIYIHLHTYTESNDWMLTAVFVVVFVVVHVVANSLADWVPEWGECVWELLSFGFSLGRISHTHKYIQIHIHTHIYIYIQIHSYIHKTRAHIRLHRRGMQTSMQNAQSTFYMKVDFWQTLKRGPDSAARNVNLCVFSCLLTYCPLFVVLTYFSVVSCWLNCFHLRSYLLNAFAFIPFATILKYTILQVYTRKYSCYWFVGL